MMSSKNKLTNIWGAQIFRQVRGNLVKIKDAQIIGKQQESTYWVGSQKSHQIHVSSTKKAKKSISQH